MKIYVIVYTINNDNKKGEGVYVVRQVIEGYDCVVSSKKDCLVFGGAEVICGGGWSSVIATSSEQYRLKHTV